MVVLVNMAKKINLSLVIPVYNESHRLASTLAILNSWQAPTDLKIDKVIFVNDGSTDTSLKILKSSKINFPKKIISYDLNRGKGNAIRRGLLTSTSDYTLIMDADLATPLSQLERFIPDMKKATDVIIGTRKNGHSTVTVHQPFVREHLGRVYTRLTQLILGVPITDFTCGFKAFSQKAIENISPRSFINRWSYDSELLFLAYRFNLSIHEVAVVWADQAGTRVNLLRDSISSFADLLKIRLNYLFGNYQIAPEKSSCRNCLKLLVISSFPEDGMTHGNATVGVASYTKNTLDQLQAVDESIDTTVWSESNGSWKRDSFISLLQLAHKLFSADFDHLFLPHEFNMFGSPLTLVFFPLYLLISKIKNKPSTLVLHQVISDFKPLSGHTNFNHFVITILNNFSRLYYFVLVSLSTQTIVFDEFLKTQLSFMSTSKVHVVAHGVEKSLTKKSKSTKIFNLTYFGYLAHYKGIDWLISAFKNYLDKYPNSNLRLTIAGGPNPNHLDKSFYRRFLRQLYALSRHPQIKRIGFVPQEKIVPTLNSADVVILPYRAAMSSSGPLALALSLDKPFIFSDSLLPYIESADFQLSMDRSATKTSDFTFALNQTKFDDLLNSLVNHPNKIKQLQRLSASLHKQRAWPLIAKQYSRLIRANTHTQPAKASNLLNLSYG